MFADFEPHMSLVMKRICNQFSLDYITIKRSAPFQVRDIQRDMIKLGSHMPAAKVRRSSENLSSRGVVRVGSVGSPNRHDLRQPRPRWRLRACPETYRSWSFFGTK